MRNTRKWLVFMLCAMLLVSNLSIGAMAAENESPIKLQAAASGSTVKVQILATETQAVADGKLVLTYDPALATYAGIEIGAAWGGKATEPSINDKTAGKVILAFANTNTADEGVLFTVTFTDVVADCIVTLGGDGNYTTGHKAVPSMDVTLCPSTQFADLVGTIDLIHEAADYMVGSGYMNGMDASHFGPNLELNRAMMVTILYRIAGEPVVSGTHAFNDVPADQFYTTPVIWAVENSITNGVSEHLFAPGKSLTRQELVTFLYRFAQYMKYDVTKTTDLSAYTDAGRVQTYAVEAFQWAVASGVVTGTSETTLSPENTTTRAQICIMVSRLLKAQN